jgi:hypothetical protein
MKQRLDFFTANPNAISALLALEDRIGKSSPEKSPRAMNMFRLPEYGPRDQSR